MLKYAETLVTCSEVPDEIALAINITNCPNHCEGCHSSWLSEDTGKPLNWSSLNALIHINKGITCVAFMGGDVEPKTVNKLAEKVKQAGLKTCWYSGKETLSEDIDLRNFDYIKLGPYKEECGPLNDKRTNQKFYKVETITLGHLDSRGIKEYGKTLIDQTSKFWS